MSTRRSSKPRARGSRPRRSRRSSQGSGQAFSNANPSKALVHRPAISQRYRAKLGYNEQFTATPASGSSDGYVISLQSVYDPRFAAGGHQPQYFDQLAALWTYFVVTNVTLRLTISPDADVMTSGSGSNTSVYQAAGLIAPFSSTSGTRPSSAASDMLEWAGSITKPIATSGNAVSLALRINLPKMLGIRKDLYCANPAFWGTNGGNPSTMLLFAWCGVIAQGAGSPSPSLCQLTVEYDVTFFGVVSLATS